MCEMNEGTTTPPKNDRMNGEPGIIESDEGEENRKNMHNASVMWLECLLRENLYMIKMSDMWLEGNKKQHQQQQ